MNAESHDALRQAVRKTQQTFPADVRAITESLREAQRCESTELLLVELRLQRERLKRLISMLSEEASESRGPNAHSARHRCRGRSAGVLVEPRQS